MIQQACFVCCFLYEQQLQRNILATCPRVTRFKIDWADNEMGESCSSENVAPPSNTESESNQMMMDSSDATSVKPAYSSVSGVREDSLGCIGATTSNGVAAAAVLTDSNQMMAE
jgi:hypothetical protein